MKKIIKMIISFAFVCILGVNSEKVFSNYSVFDHEIIVKELEESSLCVGNIQTATLQTRAKAAYLMDFDTQTVMYAHNETRRLPIASMCKIMTLLLCFDSIHTGALNMNEEIYVSERASSMGGSQVFLEANEKYSVENLIKSIVICSANDSCVAMAEKIAGSERIFVDKMNEKAQQLGMVNTLFANCTGLPKEPQYSCAKDVALMLKQLLFFDEYYRFSNVWMDKFCHPEGRYTEITTAIKLVRFYDGCDGGKTGFTNEAGFCLAATAKRNNLRLISVVIGEESSANRFEDVRESFDYAFAQYENVLLLEEGKSLKEELPVLGGKQKMVKVTPARSLYTLEKRSEKSNVEVDICVQKIKAPIKKGTPLGEIVVFKNGIEEHRVPLLAMEDVEKASFLDRLREIAQNWNK